jgi:hypothetical protein
MNNHINKNLATRFKLSKEQIETYLWLKEQHINTDDLTFCYWVKTYSAKRIKEVIVFGKERQMEGQVIQNIGGWINRFLKTGQIVVNDICKLNRKYVFEFVSLKKWSDLKIYEKYVKDDITGDDLPLTIANEDFKRSLQALYEKSRIYK